MTAMTMAEKVALVKTILNMTGTAEDARITAYLNAAAREILSWRYSYSVAEVNAVPTEYEITQVYAVVAGYSQAGAEAQRVHNENGVNTTFRYSDMMDYIRANVVPICRVIG